MSGTDLGLQLPGRGRPVVSFPSEEAQRDVKMAGRYLPTRALRHVRPLSAYAMPGTELAPGTTAGGAPRARGYDRPY
eukprot:90572-Rhodomonas_salina.4